MRKLACFVTLLSLCMITGPVGAQENDLSPVVTAELDKESVLVGQPIVLRVTVLVPTWMPSPPQFPSFEVPNLIVRLPERASGPVSQTIDGETWSGVSRAYRLYPMVPGPFILPSQTLTLTYADPDDTSPVTANFLIPSLTFTSTVPDAARSLDPLIIAESLTLEQSLEGPEDVLSEGEALKRNVVATIGGSSALFLPDLLKAAPNETTQVYKDEPSITESEDRGVLSGSRTETVTYVARHRGMLILPDISLEWFNTGSGQVETASLAGKNLNVDAPERPREPLLTTRQIVLLVLLVLFVLLSAIALYRWLRPKIEGFVNRRRSQHFVSESYAAGRLRAAIKSQDLSQVTSAKQLWDNRLPACTEIEEDQFQNALLAVGEARFGQGASADWNGVEKSFTTLRKVRLVAANHALKDSELPPLNPFELR